MRRVTFFVVSWLLLLLLPSCTSQNAVMVEHQPVGGPLLLLGDDLFYRAVDGIYQHPMNGGSDERIFWLDPEEEVLGLSATSDGLTIVTQYDGTRYEDDAAFHLFLLNKEGNAPEASVPFELTWKGQSYRISEKQAALIGQKFYFESTDGTVFSAEIVNTGGKRSKKVKLNYQIESVFPEREEIADLRLESKTAEPESWQPTWYGETLPKRFWDAGEPWAPEGDDPYVGVSYFDQFADEDFGGYCGNKNGTYTAYIKGANEAKAQHYAVDVFGDYGFARGIWILNSANSYSELLNEDYSHQAIEWSQKLPKPSMLIYRERVNITEGTVVITYEGADWDRMAEELDFPSYVVPDFLSTFDVRLDERIPREPNSTVQITSDVTAQMEQKYYPKGTDTVSFQIILSENGYFRAEQGVYTFQKYAQGEWHEFGLGFGSLLMIDYFWKGENDRSVNIGFLGTPGKGLYRFRLKSEQDWWLEFAIE